jgi:hypothetical protein
MKRIESCAHSVPRAGWIASLSPFARGTREPAARVVAPSGSRLRRSEPPLTACSVRSAHRARQRAHLARFDEQFSAMVDLVCDAAHTGLRPGHQQEYSGRRCSLKAHYRSVGRLLARFWDPEQDDPFLMLLSPATIEQSINSVDSLTAINRAREALGACQAWLDT